MKRPKTKKQSKEYRSGYEAGYKVNVDYVKSLRAKLKRANDRIQKVSMERDATTLLGRLECLQMIMNVPEYDATHAKLADIQAERKFKMMEAKEHLILIGKLRSQNIGQHKSAFGGVTVTIRYIQYAFIVDDPRLEMDAEELDRCPAYFGHIMNAPSVPFGLNDEGARLSCMDSERILCRRNAAKLDKQKYV